MAANRAAASSVSRPDTRLVRPETRMSSSPDGVSDRGSSRYGAHRPGYQAAERHTMHGAPSGSAGSRDQISAPRTMSPSTASDHGRTDTQSPYRAFPTSNGQASVPQSTTSPSYSSTYRAFPTSNGRASIAPSSPAPSSSSSYRGFSSGSGRTTVSPSPSAPSRFSGREIPSRSFSGGGSRGGGFSGGGHSGGFGGGGFGGGGRGGGGRGR